MKKLSVLAALALASAPSFAEQFVFATSVNTEADTLVIFKAQEQQLEQFKILDAQTKGQLSKAISAADFKAGYGEFLEVLAPANLPYQRVVFAGVGKESELDKAKLTKLGGNLTAKLDKKQINSITFDTSAINTKEAAALLAHGINLRAYRFETYIKEKRAEKNYHIKVSDQNASQKAYKRLANIEKGVFLARDLTSEIATQMTPADFAKAALELKKLGVEVKVLTPKEIKKLGMGALEAVGRGSSQGSRLVVAHYKGSDAAPIALVGKGITFDSGGYNIKAGASIANMKSDMAGAAAALGTIKALALSKSKQNVVAVMGMAANMVSESSVAPGDVVRTAEGLTVEILNTDAEGRLVLSDAMWYAREYFKPAVMVDIATLTGSKVRALGDRYAGVFSEDDSLVEELSFAGKQVNENLWRLPLGYKDMLKSNIADLRNIGSGGPGATTAATFLQQFAGDVRWAHLDIAGNALSSSGKGEVSPGGTGYSVRLLSEWILSKDK
jgi:leucyl aminopeptidase